MRGTATSRLAGLILGGAAVLAGAGAACAAGGEAGITPAKMQDFIWRTVNFLVFAAILIKLVTKPAKAFFAQRSQDIAQTLDSLEAQKDAAVQALKAAEERLAAVAAEREQILRQFIAEGEMEKAKIVEKAEMVAQRLKEMAAMTISQETKKAAQNLKVEVALQATQLAEEILRKQITFTDHQQLVEEYLNKVVEKH
jgi:F-type H+-transporting ATPase subunit b